MASSTLRGRRRRARPGPGDAALRADWHAWHLIGDVLRSEDLASDPRHDRDFCAAVARRACRPSRSFSRPRRRSPTRRRRRVDRRARPSGAGRRRARSLPASSWSSAPSPSFAPATSPTAQVALRRRAGVDRRLARRGRTRRGGCDRQPVAIVADSKIIRDAQLDRYLDAHKQFAGTSALGVPSAFLRSATVDSAAR